MQALPAVLGRFAPDLSKIEVGPRAGALSANGLRFETVIFLIPALKDDPGEGAWPLAGD